MSLGTSGTAYAVMDERTVDPSGTVAGFADASGRFLPLTATLNATLAVDRVAEWLGLEREAAAERTDVVVLPYLDGERTPNLPRAAGMIAGLRHSTSREEILLAAYEGAAASLVEALQQLSRLGSGLDPDAPLILIGGGARGEVWQRTVARLSSRRVLVPDADELVALGAAVQAAACLSGELTAMRSRGAGGRAPARRSSRRPSRTPRRSHGFAPPARRRSRFTRAAERSARARLAWLQQRAADGQHRDEHAYERERRDEPERPLHPGGERLANQLEEAVGDALREAGQDLRRALGARERAVQGVDVGLVEPASRRGPSGAGPRWR